ncbi:MAG: hypothetical protein DI585_02710 [Pseudomonas fluorescens]|nr:MAG: hypothetical protein DI585_02710 [Pseudomonas fluorescens]
MLPRIRQLLNYRLTLTVALTDTGNLHTYRPRVSVLFGIALFAVSGWLGMVLAGDLAGARLTATLTGNTEAKYYLDMISELRSQRDAEREQMRTIAQQLGVLQARLDRFDALGNKLKAEGTIIDVSGTIDMEGEEDMPDGRGGPEELPPMTTVPSMEIIRQQVTTLTDKADTAEIALETSLALAIRNSLGLGGGGAIPYLWPVITDTYRLSSPFGWRSDPFRKFRKWHGGMDIADKLQSPVIAAADGTVTFVGWRMGYGNLVELKHENGFTTRYGHLTRGTVKEGQRVNAGDLIALMGSTGRSTGSHLHFEVRKDDNPLNPLAFIKDTRDQVLQQARAGKGRQLLSEYRNENKSANK